MTEDNKNSNFDETKFKDSHVHNNELPILVDTEMKTSFLSYAMSVIVSRALPDVRDGLKPVHRRILYSMQDLGLTSNKAYKKSARIVGDCLGKYHPHGDTAVYDAMVRMVQPFSLRYPLVKGQGNFGSVDGDNSAAMRYTEAKMNKLSEEMLEDLNKNTVDLIPNFDGSLKEPDVLPAKFPNLLLNGSSGIAVGMATNIPPHNLKEVNDAIIHLIDNPDAEVDDLIKYVRGPDFPTGGIILGHSGIKHAYHYGKGKVIVSAKIEIEEKKGKTSLIITEIPYMVNKTGIIDQIVQLVKDKKIEGISDLRDESDREGMRIVIELKKDSNLEIIKNKLLKYTRLKVTFGVNMLALVNKEPKVLNLKNICEEFIKHRVDVITRRSLFDLDNAEKKAHILEGLIIALNDIDKAITLIKNSKSAKEAKSLLIENYNLSEIQSQAILDLKLQRLTGLEQDKIRAELSDVLKLIEHLKDLLSNKTKILQIIKKDLEYITEKYSDDRRTEILDIEDDWDIDYEDLIEREDVVITISRAGYFKRIPLETYKEQRRGGKGIIGARTKEEDVIKDVFICSTHDYLLCFTNFGNVHWIKSYKIPESGRTSKGKSVNNLIKLDSGEIITTCIPVKEFNSYNYLVMATKHGIIKKTSLDNFSKPRSGGIRAISLDKDDLLLHVVLTDGSKTLMLATENGMAIKFKEENVRSIGRTGRGVKGINLRNDFVVSLMVVDPSKAVLTLTENGFGKRTAVSDYRLTHRGGVGVTNIKTSERNGKVVSVESVFDDDQIILISKNGIILRTNANQISKVGRHTIGVRVMRMGSDDKLVGTAVVKEDEGSSDN